MKVPLLDLTRQYEQIRNEIENAVSEVIESQRFILGPKVEELEEQIAKYCQCSHAVGVSSGTDALLISLMCAQVGQGDFVITTPYTFFATAGAIARVGAIPLFVDINSETYNMDPEKLGELVSQLPEEKKRRVKAIIPVHLYGQCADMEQILESLKGMDIVVIEDAAQAIGSEYEFSNGLTKRAGAMGDYGCFSFFPSKNLGAFGDGGMVTVNDDSLYERLKILRVHGSKPKYYHKIVGGNFRLDSLQAAVLSVKLKYLDKWTKARQNNAQTYRTLFHEAGLDDIVTVPVEKEKRHIYNQFVIRVREKRDELRNFLQSKGIGTEVYYPVALHVQDCFKDLGYREGDFPESIAASRATLALPIFPELRQDELEYVVNCIKDFFSGK